jgi:hypothetical protein
MDAPLKEFGQERGKADNKQFTHYNGMPFIVGQRVEGTWVNCDGRTYGPVKGKIDYNENTGFWVVADNGGITPVKLFWLLYFDTEFLGEIEKI